MTQVYTLKTGNSHLTMETTVENPNEDIDYGNKDLNESAAGKSSTGMVSAIPYTNAAIGVSGPYGYYPTPRLPIAIGKNENVKEYFLGNSSATYSDNYARIF